MIRVVFGAEPELHFFAIVTLRVLEGQELE